MHTYFCACSPGCIGLASRVLPLMHVATLCIFCLVCIVCMFCVFYVGWFLVFLICILASVLQTSFFSMYSKEYLRAELQGIDEDSAAAGLDRCKIILSGRQWILLQLPQWLCCESMSLICSVGFVVLVI